MKSIKFYGYQLLDTGETATAIELFKLNMEMFSFESNTDNSLAEAYMRIGDREHAIKFNKKRTGVESAKLHNY